MGFGSSVIVARLVTPRDFGILGMATAVSTAINVFVQFGLARYIIREKHIERQMLRSLFTCNTVLTLGYFAGIQIGAFVAYRTNAPEVGKFLFLFSLFPLIAIFEFIPNSLCARDGRFGVISAIAVMRTLVLSAVTIALAREGFAYMSFAWASVLASLSTAVTFNIVCFHPEAWLPRFEDFKKLTRFGVDMIGVSGLSQLSSRVGEMALGSILGLASLGLYTRASSLPNTIYTNVYSTGANVIFSRLAKDLRESGSFHETYFRFMRLLLGLLWPAMLGMAILAEPIVYVLYGPRWQGAALPLSMLMIATAVTLAIGMSAEVYVLRHETRRQAKIETFRAFFGLLLFVGGAVISLPIAAAGKLVEITVAYVIYRRPMGRLVGGPSGRLEKVYLESLTLSLIAAAPSTALMIYNLGSPTTPLLEVLASAILGIAFWALALIKCRHPLIEEVLTISRAVLHSGSRTVA